MKESQGSREDSETEARKVDRKNKKYKESEQISGARLDNEMEREIERGREEEGT